MVVSNVITLINIMLCLRKTKKTVTKMGYLQILPSNALSEKMQSWS